MAIQIEVMYAQPDYPGSRHLTRKRVDVRFAYTLQRDNVLHLILSATTTAARSRNKVDGVDKERVGEWTPNRQGTVTQDCCTLYKRGNDFALGGVDDRELSWRPESDPISDAIHAPREFNPTREADVVIYFYAGYTNPALRLHAQSLFDSDMF